MCLVACVAQSPRLAFESTGENDANQKYNCGLEAAANYPTDVLALGILAAGALAVGLAASVMALCALAALVALAWIAMRLHVLLGSSVVDTDIVILDLGEVPTAISAQLPSIMP